MSWNRVAVFLLLGYLGMGRSFAYLGVAPLKLFVGELALGIFLVLRPTSVFRRWGTALVRAEPLSGVAWALYAFLAFGIFEVLRGINAGYSILTAAQNLAFNYYALFLFVGIWAGTQRPDILPRLIRWLAWWNGIYGTAYILGLGRLGIAMPGQPDVSLLGQPGGSAPVLLGLICFEPKLLKVWPLLLLNSFVLLGVQIRGDWLAFGVGFLIWGITTRRIDRLMSVFAGGAALLTVAFLIDFRMPAPAGRGGEISVRGTFARIIAPINPDLARQYSDNAEAFAGSVSWRTDWWNAIWASVNSDWKHFLVGHGYGFPLGDLVPYLSGDRTIRSPHNVFYYALGYGGWLGVGFFFFFQLALLQVLLRSYLVSGQPFGVAYWGGMLAGAFFGNFMETPFGAIPFYLLTGVAAAPAVAAIRPAAPLAFVPQRARTLPQPQTRLISSRGSPARRPAGRRSPRRVAHSPAGAPQ